MTENIQEMRKRHQAERVALQTNCQHKELSNWMQEEWAPAHSTGFWVKVCLFCGTLIKRGRETENGVVELGQ